jgi:hypothetical protein
MCEGYMIYSSAKLREGEEIWLSRSSANEVKKTPKSVSAKKEDHVVRSVPRLILIWLKNHKLTGAFASTSLL